MTKTHKKILDYFHFEHAGSVERTLKSDEYDGMRVIYAITDPNGDEIVYVGDTEVGRDVRGRLKAHLKDRDKAGLVENDSDVYIHVMVTEFAVLSAFEEDHGHLPKLNKRKSQKNV